VPALRELREHSRELEIGIDVRNPFELERALQEERIDLAVGPFKLSDPEIEQIALHRERLSLYVGQGHALYDRNILTLRDLAGLDYVMRGYLRESQVVQQHVSFNYCATAQSLEGIAQLILTGQYVGYLPEHYAATWQRSRRMQCVLPEAMSYDVHFKVIAPRNRRRTRAAEAFIRLLQVHAAAAEARSLPAPVVSKTSARTSP
jgi:DNA-binding transcriptional LysR family regulator